MTQLTEESVAGADATIKEINAQQKTKNAINAAKWAILLSNAEPNKFKK